MNKRTQVASTGMTLFMIFGLISGCNDGDVIAPGYDTDTPQADVSQSTMETYRNQQWSRLYQDLKNNFSDK